MITLRRVPNPGRRHRRISTQFGTIGVDSATSDINGVTNQGQLVGEFLTHNLERIDVRREQAAAVFLGQDG